ncbi:MAG: nucleotidyl transferase AbiEii/AbiGii toxin family protein [Elusimicrobiota bacterium]
MRKEFIDQARLMLRLMPHVAAEESFALKGGTAINFFVWDMPRLSVDIDLTYLPIEPRAQSLGNISDALLRIKRSIVKASPGFNVHESKSGGLVLKLVVRAPATEVKIEPNTVIRGAIHSVVTRDLSKKARATFEAAVKVRTLSEPELFGGKICAALDRQHPRDLFDVKILLDGPGLTSEIRKGFLVHLISHDRPMHEVIDPTRKDVRESFESEFKEMTDEPVSYEALIDARERLIAQLKKDLTNAEKRFLLSVKKGEPDWPLLGIDGVERLPAVQWKLKNIAKMDAAKSLDYTAKLKKKLGL